LAERSNPLVFNEIASVVPPSSAKGLWRNRNNVIHGFSFRHYLDVAEMVQFDILKT